MAANDVEHAAMRAGKANPPDHPEPDITHRRHFYYLARVAQGHLFEGIAALRTWEQDEPELRKLIQNLDAEGRKAAKQVRGLEQRIGAKARRPFATSPSATRHPARACPSWRSPRRSNRRPI